MRKLTESQKTEYYTMRAKIARCNKEIAQMEDALKDLKIEKRLCKDCALFSEEQDASGNPIAQCNVHHNIYAPNGVKYQKQYAPPWMHRNTKGKDYAILSIKTCGVDGVYWKKKGDNQ
ncbi:MAG: hypothetical protein R8M45_06620 [Ghiorsea sp.]